MAYLSVIALADGFQHADEPFFFKALALGDVATKTYRIRQFDSTPLLTSSATAIQTYRYHAVTSPWLGPPLHRSASVCSGNLPPFLPPGVHLGRFWGQPACSRDNHHLGEGKTPNGPIWSTSGVFALSRYSPSCPGLREHFLPTGKTVTSTPWQ